MTANGGGGAVENNRHGWRKGEREQESEQPADGYPDGGNDHDLDDGSRGHHRVGGADGFQHADLGDLLQDLDLEESADDQHANEQRKAALGVEGALLGGIARQGLDGSTECGGFNFINLGGESLADFIDLGRIIQFDQDHIRLPSLVLLISASDFGRMRSQVIKGTKMEGCREYCCPSVMPTTRSSKNSSSRALRDAHGERVAQRELAAQDGVAVDDHFFGQVGAELAALHHRRFTGVAGFHAQQGYFERFQVARQDQGGVGGAEHARVCDSLNTPDGRQTRSRSRRLAWIKKSDLAW